MNNTQQVSICAAVRATYLAMLDEGRIDEATVNVLMDSTDTAIDLASEGAVCDWNCLLFHIKLPKYLNYILAIHWSRQFVLNFALNCLQSACYACLAFIDAHKVARQELVAFFGRDFLPFLSINLLICFYGNRFSCLKA